MSASAPSVQKDVEAARADEARRLPVPSDPTHARILFQRAVKQEFARPRFYVAKLILPSFMMMMFTAFNFFQVFFSDSSTSGVVTSGPYVLYPGTQWQYPASAIVSGTSTAAIAAVSLGVSQAIPSVTALPVMTSFAFFNICSSLLNSSSDAQAVGIFVNSSASYSLVFGTGYPFDVVLAGAQHAVDGALLQVNGAVPINASLIQKTPTLQNSTSSNLPASILVGAIASFGITFGTAVSSGLVLSPLLADSSNGIVRSFRLVGVKLHVYLYAMVAYFVLLVSLPSAGVLTGVSIGWLIFNQSNAGFVFVSNALFTSQLGILYVLLAQTAQRPDRVEVAINSTFLLAIFVAIIGLPLAIFSPPVPPEILMILTVLHPFFGTISYTFIYCNAQASGGVWSSNIVSSGLLATMICQIFGIVFWLGVVFVLSSPRFLRFWLFTKSPAVLDPSDSNSSDSQTKMEALPFDADVVVQIRRLFLTFPGKKKVPPVQVLRGLDMDVCRNQVFGFLGHNGSGKTTTINILCGELWPSSGDAVYRLFGEGDKGLESVVSGDVRRIRGLIGVCPQHNPHMGKATCRETLRLFAMLKGRLKILPGQTVDDAIEAEVEARLAQLKFSSAADADKPIETFSGGMKRKVSIGIALLGDPEVVFLDEPTAGMDPYSRRQVWDMIADAKRNRAIVLTTHMMDEADILSDRVGILRDGKLVACGSPLFLKHQFAGYTLKFSGAEFNVSDVVPAAEAKTPWEWKIPHGNEAMFATLIEQLQVARCTNVVLEITTLEQVFLETGKEDYMQKPKGTSHLLGEVSSDLDIAAANDETLLKSIWLPISGGAGQSRILAFWALNRVVLGFLFKNWSRTSGVVYLNLIQPVVIVVATFVASHYITVSIPQPSSTASILPLSPFLVGAPAQCFGLQTELGNHSMAPLVATSAPLNIANYFSGLSVACGYWNTNQTLQYSGLFGLQVAELVLANAALWSQSSSGVAPPLQGFNVSVVQLPSLSPRVPFRIDTILLPLGMVFGVVGMVMIVLDVLMLKDTKVFELFRVAGISEWHANLCIVGYKTIITALPATILIILCGCALQTVLFGNGGRWLGTLMALLFYWFSVTPMSLLVSKLIVSDYNTAKNWVPAVYMNSISIPYTAYAIALQLVSPAAYSTVVLVGDILTALFPPFAFQRAALAIIYVSSQWDDPTLTWAKVWGWSTRLWYCLVMMIVDGLILWLALYRASSGRPRKTTLRQGEKCTPAVVVSGTVEDERSRGALLDQDGIRALDLVKIFRLPSSKLKVSVGGVSFGIARNEIFALIGPNGAGKSVTMGVLTGEHTPEYGEFSLDHQRCTDKDLDVGKLFSSGKVAYCPQFDPLFANLTVVEHVRFYAAVRGLVWEDPGAQAHANAIINLLGLRKHENKRATELSGGYKRRLSLAVALVGYPHVMLIDEVTTGMDPAARHLVWAALKPEIAHPEYELPAMLLSTHYMDEASKLGNRIGIMIAGTMATTGTLAHLQDCYCRSYHIEVALKADAPRDAQERLMAALEGGGMQHETSEQMPHRFKVQIPFIDDTDAARVSTQLANIYALLESNKDSIGISFYSVYGTTLEQIFIELAKKQFAAVA